jgi:integrase
MAEQKRRPHGTGGLYHPSYTASDGTSRRLATWWVAYRVGGKLVRESAKTTVKAEAERFLRRRLEAAGSGRIGPEAHRTTLATLGRILADDYAVNGREPKRAEQLFRPLLAYFKPEAAARSLTTDRLRAFQADQIGKGRKPATINRYFAGLRRAFYLAQESGRVEAVPKFPMLSEKDYVRKGFVERAQHDAILAKAVDWLRPVLTFFYLTGWRRSEALRLEWRQVDLDAGVIRLEPGTTKNKSGRTLPFHTLPELRDALKAQRELTEKMEREQGAIIPWVFHASGAPLVDGKGHPRPLVYEAWRAATTAAGLPGRLLHDFRRSCVRNMERAGVSRSVAMQITGHKTESVYRRYAIVSEADIAEGLAKVAALPKKARS